VGKSNVSVSDIVHARAGRDADDGVAGSAINSMNRCTTGALREFLF
jgi:hypothetical protein